MAAADGTPGASGPMPADYSAGYDQSEFLTDIAVESMIGDDNFLAPQVFPVIPTDSQYGTIRTWDRGSLLRPNMKLASYGDRPNQSAYKRGPSVTFACEHWDDEKVITPKDRGASYKDPLKPERDAAAYHGRQAALNIDLRWTRKYFGPNGWAWQYQGVSGTPNPAADTPEFIQFDQAGANPAQYIRSRAARMLAATGFQPNVLIMGIDVYNHLVFNEDIVDRIKYVQQGIADTDLMAALFGVSKIIVAKGVFNAAAEGLDDDMQFIVNSKAMLFLYVSDVPGEDMPSAGRMMVWNRLYDQFEGDSTKIANEMAIIRKGYDPRSGVKWVQVHTAVDLVATAADLGAYFADVVQDAIL